MMTEAMLPCDRAIGVSIATWLLLAAVCGAAEEVRDYPDPGYHRIGVYGGGPKKYFDYNLAKMSLSDAFPNKKAYWAQRKIASQDKTSAESPHTIHVIYCGVREGKSFDVCRQRIDAWLKPEPGIPTYPETINAICLEEENIGGRSELMDRLARHIRDNYGVPVFQWYTDPLLPSTAVTADGWIWDSYGWSPERFRRHVMGFVLLGKPVICVPWASDPHWPQWTQYPTTSALIDSEWHQFTTCMEFNVSTAPFCVAGPGAMNPWLSSGTPDMIHLRRALRAKRRQMRALRPGTLPLATANFSEAARAIPVGGDPGEPSVYVDDFNGATIVRDATISGFLDLQLSSRPGKPGMLIARPRRRFTEKITRRPLEVQLTYHLHSYFPLKRIRARLDATAPIEVGARNAILVGPLSSQANTAALAKRTSDGVNGEDLAPISLEVDDEQLKGMRDVLVRVQLTQRSGDSNNLSHRLDRLVFECEHQPPKPGATAVLRDDMYGNLRYDDDFTTTRWKYFGGVQTGHPSHAGFRGSSFWVGLKGGHALSSTVVQRFSAPRALKQLEVAVDGYANAPDLGGTMQLSVAPRGGKALWSIQSQGRHRGRLALKIPADQLQGDRAKIAEGLREFDVRVVLRSTSGVENGEKACAEFSRLSVRAR